MTNLFNVLAEVGADLEKITEQDVQRAGRSLKPIQRGEKALGTIHNGNLRELWALADGYLGQAQRLVLDARLTANSREEMQEMAIKATRADSMGDLCRELFWAQAKEDIGDIAWQTTNSMGMRGDWMLVSIPENDPAEIIGGILARLRPPEEE